ncbi:MAG: hypothetical protein E7298_09985 [Lachnospiraceae bacterium]|nr:hypothetical protein [Lachnospiraceae bacterium]
METEGILPDKDRVVVLGAGVAGLSASYHLRELGYEAPVIERDETYGGLCNSFCIDGFVFDTFAHISFDNEPYTYSMFEGKTEHWTHSSEALNYCDGNWVRNPVQNNLIGLPVEERIKILESYIKRTVNPDVKTYDEWLCSHFGDYFAERYPRRYTRKYWTIEADKLEPKWIEGRMTTPDLNVMLRSAMVENKEIAHYSKEARYPVKGGFKEYLRPLAKNTKILYNVTVTQIDVVEKNITLSDGRVLDYEGIVSTIPLPELIKVIKDVPDEIMECADRLDHTSGAMISLGFSRPKVCPRLWFYIYDEDIFPSRIYAPDWKSINNVPDGCSAIQAEVDFSKYKPLKCSLDDLKEEVIDQLLKLELFDRSEIVVSDIRYREYANVMFTPQIYDMRTKIHRYLNDIGISYAGRWGMWDYLWVGQSFRSGRDAAYQLAEERKADR